jgi:hypothetical protein
MSSHPNESCVNCHFFSGRYAVATGPYPFEVEADKRALSRENDISWINHIMSLECSRLVWSEGFDAKPQDRFRTIVETERKGYCFFFPYHPGMLQPAAELLEKRSAEAKDAHHDRRLTIGGLLLAATALVVQAVLAVIEIVISSSKP